MAIPDSFIQELKFKSDIADVVSSYVTLKKSGRNLVGLCPFHNEKTPSFSVSRDKGFFYCFGCGVGGDVITFIKKIENLDYIDALRFLAKRAGLEVPEDNGDSGLSRLRGRILEANREAARFYYRQLYSPMGREGLEYLRGRGLLEKTIAHFGLGFSPASGFELVNFLKSRGFAESELINANLALRGRSGKIYDRFSNRVMFPIIDIRGNVLGFGGRIMSDQKPKYLNTADTPVFNKSTNLFSLQFAKNAANDTLILAEGYMDVIALHQAGFENAVATLGTSLTQEQALIIKRYCKNVVICYDSDNAGQRAADRAISILKPADLNIKVITIPDGKDPDEFIKNHGDRGAELFRKLIEKSYGDMKYRFENLKKKYNLENPEERNAYLNDCARLIATLDNAIEQDNYMSELSREYNLEKHLLERQIDKFRSQNKKNQYRAKTREIQMEISARSDRLNPEKANNLRAANAEEALIACVIDNPDFVDTIFSEKTEELFATDLNKRIFRCLYKRVKAGQGISLMELSGEFSGDEISRIAKIMARHEDPLQKNREAAKEYLSVLIDEKQRIKPEDAANSGNETIMQYMEILKAKKQ